MFETISSGGLIDADELVALEEYIEEGQRGLIQFSLRGSVPNAVISQLNKELQDRGVEEGYAIQSGNTVSVYWRKGFPWLAVIAAIILGIIILLIMIIGWTIFKEVFPPEIRSFAGTVIVAFIVLIGYKIIRSAT